MDDLAVLRHFNRIYTQRVGVLEDSFLGMGRPLSVSRLLYEIGAVDSIAVAVLREMLGMDSGQLARTLRRLEREGLVTTTPDPADRRRRIVRLTGAGREVWQEMEARSDLKASELLTPLTPHQRRRLHDALETADLLVRAATVEFCEVPVDDPRARTAQHAYFAELHERMGYQDPGPEPVTPGAVHLVACSDGQPVAHGELRPEPTIPDAGELKRLWVHRDWRGAGLGSRTLRRLETLARDSGYARLYLDTNSALAEAVSLYDHLGYRRVDRYNDNPDAELFFCKDLIGSRDSGPGADTTAALT